jgi:hypothetical protein
MNHEEAIPQIRRREASAQNQKSLRNPNLRNLRNLRMDPSA